jgi:hypothetical protein
MADKKYIIDGREYSVWQLNNNQLVELARQGGDKDIVETIIGRFERSLCKRREEGETEWDGVCARFLSDMVNGKLWNYEGAAKKMASEHRYLQQEMFKLCLAYIKALADNYDNGSFDPRNQWACETAKAITEIV